MRYLVLLLLTSLPATADDLRGAFYGKWGTPEQCAEALITPRGSVRFSPFEIDDQWLKHGELWCQIKWAPLEEREGELFTAASARCGEDAVHGYFLGMQLRNDELTLRWTLTWVNGPLQRCPAS